MPGSNETQTAAHPLMKSLRLMPMAHRSLISTRLDSNYHTDYFVIEQELYSRSFEQ